MCIDTFCFQDTYSRFLTLRHGLPPGFTPLLVSRHSNVFPQLKERDRTLAFILHQLTRRQYLRASSSTPRDKDSNPFVRVFASPGSGKSRLCDEITASKLGGLNGFELSKYASSLDVSHMVRFQQKLKDGFALSITFNGEQGSIQLAPPLVSLKCRVLHS